MLELGAITERAHTVIGRCAGKNGIDLLLAYGDAARYYKQGAAAYATQALHFTDKQELLCALKKRLEKGDVVWIKGSRGMRLEEILPGLYEERQNG